MRVPVEWLNEYVEIENMNEKELLDGMILSGSNLESSGRASEGISGVIIGKIDKIEKHPDADKLKICSVNAGEHGVLQIVTAAKNVHEGAVIPVSMIGAKLAGGLKIKKGKLRGVDSEGMMCSFAELGYSNNVIPAEFQDGILLLDDKFEAEVGKDALEVLKMDKNTIEFEITPNRPDCLSIVGMARETAATFEKELHFEERTFESAFANKKGVDGAIGVSIETDKCARYIALTAKDIKVSRSPFEMQLRLMNAGVRPINNIVDITNYIMLEYGQPMHAFDKSTIEGDIVIRMAKDGEKVVTLDGTLRELTSEDILVADSKKPLAIAGVMGLLDSGITENTKEVVFEIASFDKTAVRATSKRLGLRSESSARFERGISVVTPGMTAVRIEELLQNINSAVSGMAVAEPCGEIVAAVDAHGSEYEKLSAPVVVSYDKARVNALIGAETDIVRELGKLGIKATDSEATIPHYRLDLKMDADLAEEVARMYGYDKLPATRMKHGEVGGIEPLQKLELNVSDALVGMGLDEVITYSFLSPAREAEVLGDVENVKLLNALGEDYSAMRTSLLPSVLDVVKRNHRRKNTELAFFELGRVYSIEKNEEGLPSEKEMLVAAMMRSDDDFFTLKGVTESLMEYIGIADYSYVKNAEKSYMHPGRSAGLIIGDERVGQFGELHPALAEQEGLGRLYVLELDMEAVVKYATDERLYHSVSMFPAAEKDVAFIVDENVTSAELELAIKQGAKNLLEEAKLFDVYRGEKLGEGKKSMAYALKFRADRTLSEEEVDKCFKKVIKTVTHQCEAVLRDN